MILYTSGETEPSPEDDDPLCLRSHTHTSAFMTSSTFRGSHLAITHRGDNAASLHREDDVDKIKERDTFLLRVMGQSSAQTSEPHFKFSDHQQAHAQVRDIVQVCVCLFPCFEDFG